MLLVVVRPDKKTHYHTELIWFRNEGKMSKMRVHTHLHLIFCSENLQNDEGWHPELFSFGAMTVSYQAELNFSVV